MCTCVYKACVQQIFILVWDSANNIETKRRTGICLNSSPQQNLTVPHPYYYWNIHDAGISKPFNLKTSSFLYVNTCKGIFSRLVSASSKSKMSAKHHANKKNIYSKYVQNMCRTYKYSVGFFFIAERVRITSKHKHTCSINNYFNFNS